MDHVKVWKHYTRFFFSEEEGLMVGSKVNLEEVKSVLKIFAKDKILALYRWTMEFFLHFFNLIGNDLV